ncbi:hypothetical protein X890_5669 [Burkholderia pseudomallei MSHR4299]|nr:hypothetical protein X890_5669 [Burkholderia pseudomallei MSHR4299]KGX48580.1 hypothetical protein Y600_6356 [Burkholderia pseudomallei MSHR3709]
MREDSTVRLRCRPGDLAIVTKCGVPERIGLLVRVVGRCTDEGYDWLTEVQGRGFRGRDIYTGDICLCKEALMHDWNLTPITGLGPRCQLDQREVAPLHGVF